MWKDDAKFDMLLEILQQQHNLDHLHLNESLFTSAQTEQLLRTITENDILWSLATLNLSYANFESDESVNLLALIIAKAHRIKQVDITLQQVGRQIDVKIDEEREWLNDFGITLKGGLIFANSEEITIYETGQLRFQICSIAKENSRDIEIRLKNMFFENSEEKNIREEYKVD